MVSTEDMDETMREEEEDEKDENQVRERNPTAPWLTVGGQIAREALCLLDGVQEDDKAGNIRVMCPVRRLPATLGRTHLTTDKNFVGLGLAKALSRQHVRIDYRVPTTAGGCGHIQSKVGFKAEFFYNADDPVAASEIVTSGSPSDAKLPETGFYTMTCLGKNRILINGNRIDQGQTALLQSGSAIRIANFALYFFTPVVPSEKTLQIRDDVAPPLAATKSSSLNPSGVSTGIPAVAGSGTGEGISSGANNNNSTGNKPSLLAEIEDLSTTELLQQMKAAVEEDVWDRRHQLIGSTISYRAIIAAVKDPELYQLALQSDGQLSRGDVMNWIAASPTFGTWVEHMLSKMEAKSYQANVTKALIKAGFKRTASSGRYIKWHVPESLYKPANTDRDKGSPSSATTEADDRKKANAPDPINSDQDDYDEEDDSVPHEAKRRKGESQGDVDEMSDDDDPQTASKNS